MMHQTEDSETTVSVKKELSQVETDARRLAESVRSLLSASSTNTSQEASQRWQKTSAQARDTWLRTRDTVKDKGKQADTYARENVWQTVGVAAAVGAVVGMLVGRRRSHD